MEAAIYSKIERVVPSLHGWCPVDKAKRMVDLILTLKEPLCVEIGVFAGRSLLPIAWACKAVGGKTVGIDPWAAPACLEGKNADENDKWWKNIDYEFFYNYTRDLMKTHAVSETVVLRREKSDTAVLTFEDKSISFFHQDGNHSEEITVKEVQQWRSKIQPGGYWVFDDTDWETTARAQELLATSGYTCIYCAEGNKWKIYQRSLE